MEEEKDIIYELPEGGDDSQGGERSVESSGGGERSVESGERVEVAAVDENDENADDAENADNDENADNADTRLQRMIEEVGAETLLEIIRDNRNAAIRQIISEVEASQNRVLQSGVSAARACNSIFDLAALA